MYCPVCRDEYRPGFTRCATCDVALVESLESGEVAPARAPAQIVAEVAADEPTVNFCGFLALDEARQARDKLREAGVPAEILIRDVPGSAAGQDVQEEFWLRVRPRDFRAVVGIVGFAPAESDPGDDSFKCSACGATVHATDDACPGCGLGFEG
jgi:hypothetical protein